jgi:hypothetical protein
MSSDCESSYDAIRIYERVTLGPALDWYSPIHRILNAVDKQRISRLGLLP